METYQQALAVGLPILVAAKFYFSRGLGLFVPQVYNNQEGKVILVTGGSDGIGLETVKYLARNGAATIVIASRNQTTGQSAIKELKENLAKSSIKVGQKSSIIERQIEYMKLDLGDLNSVKDFIQEFKAKYKNIDTIINNAGIYLGKGASAQGYEKIFATNYIAHFYLTTSLLPLMRDSPESRIINVSSAAHNYCQKNFSFLDSPLAAELFSQLNQSKRLLTEMENYSSSKLGNVMFTISLSNYLELQGSKIQVYSLCPGVVRTSALKAGVFQTTLAKILYLPVYPLYWLFTKNLYHGALTTINLATLPTSKLENGAFYEDCRVSKANKNSKDTVSQMALWNKTIALLKQEGYEVNVPQL